MQALHSDDIVDLGAISTETRGHDPIGFPDVETGCYYLVAAMAFSAGD